MVARIKNLSHEEWLQNRTYGIGASEVGALMGVNPYCTPYQLWRRKKHLDEKAEETEATIWGHLLEDAVAKRYAIATEADIVKSSTEEWIYFNENKPFLRVSPDRTYYDKGAKHTKENLKLLECKTSLMPISEDDIPESYFCQCQYQMHVMEIKHCTLAWMNLSNRTFGYKELTYDAEFCKYLEEQVTDFWTRFIEGNEEPEPTTPNDFKLKFPKSITGTKLIADEEGVNACQELAIVKSRLKAIKSSEEYEALEKREAELIEQIKIKMQDNENLVSADGSLLATFKNAKDKQVFNESKALEMHPDLSACYELKQGNRTFLIKLKA